ncbi:MAG TPA: H-type small acid-soluble spore protein [Syntrophomonadaceae bacterium]|jgi:H-type small acid-soluble spore protein|nr:H-type small acid-soluble spore protein [Syntrophomonadaceae bacterium]HQD91211.1 H-type small acid-soluble spore protein [Syntrophomonadaceae bacterium]
MLVDRAREIMESKGVIEVLYQGHPVWIEQIEQDSAHIRLLDNSHRLSVPINMLTETE